MGAFKKKSQPEWHFFFLFTSKSLLSNQFAGKQPSRKIVTKKFEKNDKMKVIVVLLFVALLAVSMKCEENDVSINTRSNRRPSLFLCDYYVQHVRRAKLDGGSERSSAKMIGRIRLSCDDALSVRKELLSIFKGADQTDSSADLLKNNYLTFDRQEMDQK